MEHVYRFFLGLGVVSVLALIVSIYPYFIIIPVMLVACYVVGHIILEDN